jgi:putative tryptophan/tyrosine transport system substrate-binding protein
MRRRGRPWAPRGGMDRQISQIGRTVDSTIGRAPVPAAKPQENVENLTPDRGMWRHDMLSRVAGAEPMSSALGHLAEASDPPERGIVKDGDGAALDGDDRIGPPRAKLAIDRLARHADEIAELALRQTPADPGALRRPLAARRGEAQHRLGQARRLVEEKRVLHVLGHAADLGAEDRQQPERDLRMRFEEGHEIAPVDHQQHAIGTRDRVGGAGLAVEQRHLAEGLAGLDDGKDHLPAFGRRRADRHLALEHGEEAVAGRALREDDAAGAVMLQAREGQESVEFAGRERLEQELPAEKPRPFPAVAGHAGSLALVAGHSIFGARHGIKPLGGAKDFRRGQRGRDRRGGGARITRRALIAALAWPLAARAQPAEMPVIGFLSLGSSVPEDVLATAFRQGLSEAGFIEGQNVVIEYRSADGHHDRLAALAADLVRRRVSVIAAAGGTTPALAAKAATSTIPIIFEVGEPVATGLVASLSRPGGNLTGVALESVEMMAKQLELVHELPPKAAVIALLVNPANPLSEYETTGVRNAARALGLELQVLQASSASDIDAAFASLAGFGAGALIVGVDEFFYSRSAQIVTLAARHGVPATWPWREFAAIGGLMSYSPDLEDAYRQMGVYVGRVLKGASPADLPVQQMAKIRLVINLKSAQALGLAIPPPLLARADEVIE